MPQHDHLGTIQGVVNRLAANSFALKAWTVTLVSAALALGAKDDRIEFALAAVVSVVSFGALDAYYLMLERRFRDLYKQAAEDKVPAYSMDTSAYSANRTWFRTIRSPSVWGLYVPLLAILAAVAFIA